MVYQNIEFIKTNRNISKRELRFFFKFLLKSQSYLPYLMRRSHHNNWGGRLKEVKIGDLFYEAFPWCMRNDPSVPSAINNINNFLPEDTDWADIHNMWHAELSNFKKP